MSINETAASGKILALGDDVNTDDIIPANFCTTADPEVLRHHAFEYIIGRGELLQYEQIHAGKNFGCGSSREHAPIALKAAGIKLVRAQSFAEIFYRNCINIGLDLILTEQNEVGDVIEKIIEFGGLNDFNRWRLQTAYQFTSSKTESRPMTMVEKILAKASGNSYLKPNEVVFCQVDLAMSHDAVAGPIADLCRSNFGENMKVWDAEKIVLVADHFIQVNDIRSDSGAPKLLGQMKEFAREQGCHLIDEVSPGEAEGICHVLLPEKGFVTPGTFIAGTDSHSCTYGAFGCVATGVGTTDMANIFVTGEMWMRVPETQVLELSGSLPENVSAKDIMLYILGRIGCDGAIGDVLEFRGEIIDKLSMEERMTLANMAIECGAVSGLMRIDKTTKDYLPNIDQSFVGIESDSNALFKEFHKFDLSNLVPQIALPSQPDQVIPIRDLEEVKITKAFIGSCTGGKLHDLAEAAKVLDGNHIHKNVTLFIVPASQEIKAEAEKLGYLDIFSKAGATLLKSGCGACINAGPGGLDKAETGIYATNRNYKGRSGDPSAHNYLASPRSVAIAAIKGEIGL